MENIKAVVLCGGVGSRLRPLTYYFQKTMLPVGLKQKPILEYIIRTLKYNGISKAVLLTNYKSEQIQNYFKSGSSLGMELEYAIDDPSLKGNGGAVLNAYQHGLVHDEETLLIYYGDILTKLDLKGMLEQHVSLGSTATLAIASGFRLPVGVAKTKGRRLMKLEEKPFLDINVGIGILALKGETLPLLEEMRHSSSEIDLMGNFIPNLIALKKPVNAFFTKEYWLDVVSIETYEKLDHKELDNAFKHLDFYEIEERRRGVQGSRRSKQ